MNRRRRVRQKVHAPAYATFRGASQSEMLDLYEVLDISEVGVAVQCSLPMKIDEHVDLCLDLAEARGQISATARVVWADSGRLGLGFPALPDSDQRRLREWLFLNAMAGAANAISGGAQPSATPDFVLRPNYTDTLSAAFAVRREAESLGSNLEAVLSLIVSRSQSMLRASGAAIALAEKDIGALICRASIGPSAPPVGAALQIGSGFSGDCVRAGKTLRCDDSETDARVDSEACRALGVRSMLASPIRSEKQVLGLIEVFSEKPNAFSNNDRTTIESLAETIVAAVNRAGAADNTSSPPPSAASFSPSPGSVLFAHYPEEGKSKGKGENKEREKNKNNKDSDSSDALADPDGVRSVRLPRSHLYLLIITAATLALALGFICAPWIQPWIHAKVQARERNLESTVLASSSPQTTESSQSGLQKSSTDSANLDQLRMLAQQGNPVAENAVGLLYAQGDDKQAIKQDEAEAARWFKLAAENGSVPAQYKLALMLWGGHGIPKDTNKAYFWAVLARAGGQEGSKDLAKVLASGMSRSQALAIEQQAEIWYQQNESRGKPQPGH
jgi:putative methionine-R-sulfoxide reductase with GAF domain